MHFNVVILKENEIYSSLCPELDIASSGKTIDEARENLKEAIELYLEDPDAIMPSGINSITLTGIDIDLAKK